MDQQDKSAPKWPDGPWSFVPSIPEEGIECYWIENGVQQIASIDGPQNDEREAIARLCAAAPELYEACMAMIEWDDAEKNANPYDDDGGKAWRERIELCSSAFKKARAALAKATGSQQ